MFAKLSSVVLALPLLAVATPWGSPTTTQGKTTTVTVTTTATATPAPQSQCNTAPVQCCNSVTTAQNGGPVVGLLIGLLGIVLENLNVPIGLTCSPVTIIGTASSWLVPFTSYKRFIKSSSCNSQSEQVPVCCENNNFGEYIH